MYGDTVHLVWMDSREDPGPGIYYSRSTNNGSQWSSETRLFANGIHPAVAVDERGLFVVCAKDGDIWYLESTDWGLNWQTAKKITTTSDADSFPDITADTLGRHVVFVRNNLWVYYKQRDIVNPAKPCNVHEDPLTVPPPVILYWYANTDADIWGYKVYRRLLPDGLWGPLGHTTDTTYTDNWVNPGYTYRYYITARDLAGNYSVPSNTVEVYIPDPTKHVDLGIAEPSDYTVQRSGYYEWGEGPDSTADFGDCLQYRFTNLIPEHDYTFGFVLFEPAFDSGRILSIQSNAHGYAGDLAVPESAQCVCFRIPKQLYSHGNLTFKISGHGEAVLSQIYIWEFSGGGPQSAGSELYGSDRLELSVLPNPIRKEFAIQYVLPKETNVNLSVFDVSGRLVTTLVNSSQQAGSYREVFSDKNISQGVYFFTLDTGGKSIATKVIFLR